MISFKERESLEHHFNYHPPTEDTKELHKKTREQILELSIQIGNNIPDCRERSLVWIKLEEAMFWANAAIARHISNPQKPEKPPLGIKPEKLVLEQRLKDIMDAIRRYENVDRKVPEEWRDEGKLLLHRLSQLDKNSGTTY